MGSDVETCLRVLAEARAADPDDPRWAPVREAVAQVYRAGKKARKAARHADRRQHDDLVSAATERHRSQNPGAAPEVVSPAGPRPLAGTRRCYTCKAVYGMVHPVYHLLCPECAEENLTRRAARCDLRGRRALITGGRVKIGFHTALKLLRDGAEVLVTTRFPADAARRFAAVPDAGEWLDRLHVHGVDLLDLRGVAGLLETVHQRFDHLDILINNAAQTIRRPSAYHREVLAAEALPLEGVAATIRLTASADRRLGPMPNPRSETATRSDDAIAFPSAASPATASLSATPHPADEVAPLSTASLPAASLAAAPLSAAALSAAPLSAASLSAGPLSADEVEALFPAGLLDESGQPLDLRERNSWSLRLHEVDAAEWLEVQLVNSFAPFLLTSRLRGLLEASPHPDRYVVQVSAMEGSFSRENKTVRHPHTNMAKAALNMLTRTSAADYAASGIHMNSVDTGWCTDERPHPEKANSRFRPPLDVVDGAARVYDPIVRGVGGHPLSGYFLKDFRPVEW